MRIYVPMSTTCMCLRVCTHGSVYVSQGKDGGV